MVVLTYDRPRALERCLHSLSAQEFHEPFEIVVADDGSGPETARVIADAQHRDARIRHVRHEHQGIPATRNLGVGAARGAYVAIVADDYVLAPDYLAVARKYLDDRPEAAVVRFDIQPLRRHLGGLVSACYYTADFAGRLDKEGITPEMACAGVATATLEAAGAAMFSAAVLAGVGPWSTSLQRGEDTDHSRRMRQAGHSIHVLAAGTVRTTYRALPTDTIRKCFLDGFYRQRFPQQQPVTGLRGVLRVLHRPLYRARSGGRPWWAAIAYLPWMIVFEGAVGAGHLRGRLTSRRGRDDAAPAAA